MKNNQAIMPTVRTELFDAKINKLGAIVYNYILNTTGGRGLLWTQRAIPRLPQRCRARNFNERKL